MVAFVQRYYANSAACIYVHTSVHSWDSSSSTFTSPLWDSICLRLPVQGLTQHSIHRIPLELHPFTLWKLHNGFKALVNRQDFERVASRLVNSAPAHFICASQVMKLRLVSFRADILTNFLSFLTSSFGCNQFLADRLRRRHLLTN